MHTNNLIHETSPYLLQHAHNPVDWHPWNDATLQKARSINKMLLISIGYSACHWCHVMERESFEDKQVAEIMNQNFICIKVDREERPDVDQVYMNAVQLVTGSGGWPLNCFALPDGRPFFGGTYFRKDQWKGLLENIALLFETRREDLEQQAESLTEGVRKDNLLLSIKDDKNLSDLELIKAVNHLESQFDVTDGGLAGTPKFPMPSVLNFLLEYSVFNKDESIKDFLRLTLRKMAFGGIYDQIGGGFARYSTDSRWKVPHFEKMLYDNAQLISLYSKAYFLFEDALFQEVIEDTLAFISREMTSAESGFFSALDADSEGEEGRFYTWTEQEIRAVLGQNADRVMKFYNVGGKGLWEDGRNILIRTSSTDEFDTLQGFKPLHPYKSILKQSRQKMLKARNQRIRPGLDNKILVSWNAMMAKGYIDAHFALDKIEYRETANKNIDFILSAVSRKDGGINHQVSNGKTQINGFLDDYAFMIEALTSLYQASLDESRLRKALELADYAIEHFIYPASGLFFYTSDLGNQLITRKTELYDNVIPASNSVMARVLKYLGIAFDREDLIEMSDKMLDKVKPLIGQYPSSFTNWASLWMEQGKEVRVIAVCGPEFKERIKAIRENDTTGILFFGSAGLSDLPYLQNRFFEGHTMMYYCTGKECKLPTEDTSTIINLLSPES
jgi:uncharacterized protein YyaL (SSP411 family)